MTQKHTPTHCPHENVEHGKCQNCGIEVVVMPYDNGEGYEIVKSSDHWHKWPDSATQKGGVTSYKNLYIASKIDRNAHDDLVKALKQMTDGINTAIDHVRDWTPEQKMQHFFGLQTIAAAALAKVDAK